MKRTYKDIQELVDRYHDGECSDAETLEVEALLKSDPAASEYHSSLLELRGILDTTMHVATERADFSGLFGKVMAAVAEPKSVRRGEMEMLAMALHDGHTLSAEDEKAVRAYLAATPEARESLTGLSEMAELIRMPIESAVERVDFDALSARVMAAIEVEAMQSGMSAANQNEAPESSSTVVRIKDYFRTHMASVASAAVAAAAVAFILPQLDSSDNTAGTTVINNYYMSVDSVSADPGFRNETRNIGMDENEELAPVIWFEPSEEAVENTEEQEQEADAPSRGTKL